MKDIKKIDKQAIVNELREQDVKLREIFDRREELKKLIQEAGCYDEIWEMLFSDHEAHYSF